MLDQKDQTVRPLILKLDGSKITTGKFRKALNAFLDTIDEVTRDFSGSNHYVKWIVSVSSGSTVFKFEPKSVNPRFAPNKLPELSRIIYTGFQTIEKSSTKPPYFSEFALKQAKTLSSIVDGEIESIKIQWGAEKGFVTPQTSVNVGALFATAYKDWGSVEGKLTEVSERGERHVYIYDRLLNKHIRCHATEEMLEDMAPYWGKRVSVSGLIHYYHAGGIKYIEAQRFEVFPASETLPGFDDVRGIFRGAD